MTTTSETIAAELAEARADAALLKRLKAADARVVALVAAYDKAKDVEARAAEQAEREAQAARFAGLKITSITAKGDADYPLRFAYTIKYQGPSYDIYTGEAYITEHTRYGFETLDDHVLEFLIERQPNRIPAAIMELAPGDPYAAFDTYLHARRQDGGQNSARYAA